MEVFLECCMTLFFSAAMLLLIVRLAKGEEKNIFPYQEEADAMFNSAMAYELCILKPIVEPLLFSITEDDPEYQEAKRLLKFLAYFLPCPADNVPINSIMREFIGCLLYTSDAADE